jgi:hypothetical protein
MSQKPFFDRKFTLIVACVALIGFIGCIAIPLGDPEKAKVDDKLVGVWANKPDENGKQTMFTVVPFDSRTCLVSQFDFTKTGDKVEINGRWDWKMWLVDVKGTTFASFEWKNPELALETNAERFACAKLTRNGDTITIALVKDDFVKAKNITTSQQLEELIAANVNNAEMYGDALELTKVKDDQKEAVGKVFEAFRGGNK